MLLHAAVAALTTATTTITITTTTTTTCQRCYGSGSFQHFWQYLYAYGAPKLFVLILPLMPAHISPHVTAYFRFGMPHVYIFKLQVSVTVCISYFYYHFLKNKIRTYQHCSYGSDHFNDSLWLSILLMVFSESSKKLPTLTAKKTDSSSKNSKTRNEFSTKSIDKLINKLNKDEKDAIRKS